MSEQPNRVRLNVRVSSDEQVKKDSPDTQLLRLKKRVEDDGDIIESVVKELGDSAYIKDDDIRLELDETSKELVVRIPFVKRPLMFKNLSDARLNLYDELMFLNWSRFSRHIVHYYCTRLFLERNGVEVTPLDDPKEPKVVPVVLMAFNQQDPETKSLRTLENQERHFEAGSFKSNPIYGYSVDKVNGEKVITIDKDRAADVIKVFLTRLQGMDVDMACGKITKLRIKKIRSKRLIDGKEVDVCEDVHERMPISPSSYRMHLQDKRYAGYISFKGEEKLGNYTPIIPLDVFDAVQRIKDEDSMSLDELEDFKLLKEEMAKKLRVYAEDMLGLAL
jgi:DNA invertase Pin-like site-specific DNA recombinase